MKQVFSHVVSGKLRISVCTMCHVFYCNNININTEFYDEWYKPWYIQNYHTLCVIHHYASVILTKPAVQVLLEHWNQVCARHVYYGTEVIWGLHVYARQRTDWYSNVAFQLLPHPSMGLGNETIKLYEWTRTPYVHTFKHTCSCKKGQTDLHVWKLPCTYVVC